MYQDLKRLFLCVFTLLRTQTLAQNVTSCKCTPGDSCWPSSQELRLLNESVSGTLLQGVPPGSVCYPDQPNYDQAQCAYVRDRWFSSTFHATNPVSVGFPLFANNPCPPISSNGTSVTGDPKAGEKGCTIGAYPAYALNATKVSHIQDVVKFAAQKNIRLNIKSTGHSFQGRSTAFGSISIWTHYLRGITYIEQFRPCPNGGANDAFRIAGGHRVRDVYEAANRENKVVVGGSAQDVGIVGWFSSGGHGPLSSTYGMGADNVMEATVVTTGGKVLITNECTNPDLFWALKGGGGGTFGVVTEVVMKAHPVEPMESVTFSLLPKHGHNDSEFYNASAFLLSRFPEMKQNGLSGYTFLGTPVPSPIFPLAGFTGSMSVFGRPNDTTASVFEPIKSEIATKYPTMNFTTTESWSPSFFQSWNATIGDEPVGGPYGILMGSRLLPAEALTSDTQHLAKVLQNLTANSASPSQFYAVANSANRGLNISLNPAWRDAVVHAIIGSGYLEGASTEEKTAAISEFTNHRVTQLKALAPDSGAYQNEGDAFDPNFQYTFFGMNYPRLKQITKLYDPNSTLWCHACVGSEDHIEDEKGRLCRVSWSRED